VDFKDLLTKEKLSPERVMVMRHVPQERKLRSMLPWLAAKRPTVFNAYQQCQRSTVGRGMMKADFIASFIGMEPKKAVFAGLYRRGDSRPVTDQQYWAISPAHELKKFGAQPIPDGESFLWFDLKPVDFYPEWKGRLEINWPPPEISWYRVAKSRTNFPVRAIHDESIFNHEMKPWRQLSFTCDELECLSPSWESELKQWRGIYFIFDVKENKGYVGYAMSIFDRWRDHVAHQGDAKKLKQCDPKNFRFTILERTSPDLDESELCRLESTWKDRLHTRKYGLNDN
jgi:GIY-YIG catalytic domain